MKFLKSVDATGKALVKGDMALFKKAPKALMKLLPLDDQNAIKAQEGKAMEIIGFDQYGHVEMEFTAADGGIYTIWVYPKELFKIICNESDESE